MRRNRPVIDTISITTAITMNAVITKPRKPGVTWSGLRPGLSPFSPALGEGVALKAMIPWARESTNDSFMYSLQFCPGYAPSGRADRPVHERFSRQQGGGVVKVLGPCRRATIQPGASVPVLSRRRPALPDHLADLVPAYRDSYRMDNQTNSDHGQRSESQPLILRSIAQDANNEACGDEPHGTKHQGFVKLRGTIPKLIQHERSLPLSGQDTWRGRQNTVHQ